MLRVQVEIVPFGQEDHSRRRTIGVLRIGLQRVKEGNVGEYVSTVEVDNRGPQPPNQVVNITHNRDEGGLELARKCIEAHLNVG